MTVSLFRHARGAVGPDDPWPDLSSLIRDAAAEGYEGVEFPTFVLDGDPAGRDAVLATLKETGLELLPMVMTFPSSPHDPDAHLAALRPQLEDAATLGVPRVNAHAGSDAFDDATTADFLTRSLAAAAEVGVTLMHETHRSRPLYNLWRTAKMVEEVEGLRLTADYSHWVCVSERLPFDGAAAFATCAPAVSHIHARVGHAQGPQVADPSDPAWSMELGSHEAWWDQIVAAADARGDDMTITPEFGPPPYMPMLPHSDEPVADLRSVVAFMRDRLTDRYIATE
jgi:sugar phosphate isomerase/epimerase